MLAAEVAVAATCCANSHRLFGITQHSSFDYLTPRQQANRTSRYVPANAYGQSPIGQCIFQEDLEILKKNNRRTPPGGTLKFEQISGTAITAC